MSTGARSNPTWLGLCTGDTPVACLWHVWLSMPCYFYVMYLEYTLTCCRILFPVYTLLHDCWIVCSEWRILAECIRMYSRALWLWPGFGEDSSSTLARRWSKSVLGSVAQRDACGVEPLQTVALVVFRCQLNSVLSHAWLDILVMP